MQCHARAGWHPDYARTPRAAVESRCQESESFNLAHRERQHNSCYTPNMGYRAARHTHPPAAHLQETEHMRLLLLAACRAHVAAHYPKTKQYRAEVCLPSTTPHALSQLSPSKQALFLDKELFWFQSVCVWETPKLDGKGQAPAMRSRVACTCALFLPRSTLWPRRHTTAPGTGTGRCPTFLMRMCEYVHHRMLRLTHQQRRAGLRGRGGGEAHALVSCGVAVLRTKKQKIEYKLLFA